MIQQDYMIRHTSPITMFYNTARYAYASNHLVAYAGAHVVVLGTGSLWELGGSQHRS